MNEGLRGFNTLDLKVEGLNSCFNPSLAMRGAG